MAFLAGPLVVKRPQTAIWDYQSVWDDDGTTSVEQYACLLTNVRESKRRLVNPLYELRFLTPAQSEHSLLLHLTWTQLIHVRKRELVSWGQSVCLCQRNDDAACEAIYHFNPRQIVCCQVCLLRPTAMMAAQQRSGDHGQSSSSLHS